MSNVSYVIHLSGNKTSYLMKQKQGKLKTMEIIESNMSPKIFEANDLEMYNTNL